MGTALPPSSAAAGAEQGMACASLEQGTGEVLARLGSGELALRWGVVGRKFGEVWELGKDTGLGKRKGGLNGGADATRPWLIGEPWAWDGPAGW